MTTLLLDPAQFALDQAEVAGEAYRHLFRALRLAVGDELRVVDGRGRARRARVERVDRQSGWLSLQELAPSLEPALRLTLLVACPRPQRASWLVEKLTEIGASAVHFLETERGMRGLARGELAHLERVAVAAVEQCGRACLPKLSGPHPLAALPGLAQEAEERIFLDPGATQLAPPRPAMGSLAVAIGPEGGWSQAERQQLRAQGFAPAGLGERTLRLETAALAAACLCLLGR